MLDIQFVRNNPDIVRAAVKNKNITVDVDKLLDRDEKRRVLMAEVELLRSKKNEINENIKKTTDQEYRMRAIEEGRRIKEELEKKEPELKLLDEQFFEYMYLLPNIPSEDTPIAKDESGNVVLRKIGKKPSFDFEPKEHFVLGEELDLIDSNRAVKVSGSRFVYLKGDLVMLEWAMMMFAFRTLTNEDILKKIAQENNIDVSTQPFIPVFPPMMIRPEMHKRMGRLDPEEMYMLDRDNLTLIGSAEHTLGAMYADEILNEKNFPIRMVGFSGAFRREAGSYGKDMKGILRLHQFNKLEMETFTLPEFSRVEQDFIVAIQEYLMKALEIPYQVLAVCTGDMGKPDYRQIDIEAWMPGQNTYRETHTSDLIGDFQARRLNTRVRRLDGTLEFVHMNDATAFSERPLIAILENNQQKDGSILIPKVLQEYVGKDRIENRKETR
ncbi:MAG: serine--tRNA ligase [Candidatus Moraniibacteriota bacterium]|nr:MAG: serine--tRNA ligase [Candidatus Moranbacteria bacterium]